MIKGAWKKFTIPDSILRKLVSLYGYGYRDKNAEYNNIKYKKSGDDFILHVSEYLKVQRINNVYTFYTKDYHSANFRKYNSLEKHKCEFDDGWVFWTLYYFMGEFLVSYQRKTKKLINYNPNVIMSCELEDKNGIKSRCRPTSIEAILPVQSFDDLKQAIDNKWSKNAKEYNLKDCLGQSIKIGSYIFYANQNHHYFGIVNGFRTETRRYDQRKFKIIRLDLIESSSNKKGLKMYELKSNQKFVVLDAEHAFRLSLMV